MLFAELAAASDAVAATRSRIAKRDRIALLLRAALPDERRAVVAWMSGELRQGKLGIGYAEIGRVDVLPAEASTLTVEDVERTFQELAVVAGRGAIAQRRERLIALFARATLAEQAFLRRVLLGELRQGGLEGVMVDAIATATALPQPLIRRAAMLTGDLPEVAALGLREGAVALERLRPAVFTPLRPMLASPADSLDAAMKELATARPALLEWKLDGARVQVHRRGDEVRVYTRALLDVTGSVPEVVEIARGLPAERVVLDGEMIALDPEGRPRPFQETQSRFARRVDVATARAETPLWVFFFDLLLLDDTLLLDRPLEERRAALARLVPIGHRVPSLETDRPEVGHAFFADALSRGHEGVMMKDPTSTYQAGSRGRSWQKVKRVHTLDLVVLAAEWGTGRRRGWLSNLHLGARDGDRLVMLGKTFKGMSDEVLSWQTEALLAREVRREGRVVHVRPELVAEFAFDEVQASPRYAGGLTLRFARLLRYRPDKRPEEADTLERVREIFVRGAVQHARLK